MRTAPVEVANKPMSDAGLARLVEVTKRIALERRRILDEMADALDRNDVGGVMDCARRLTNRTASTRREDNETRHRAAPSEHGRAGR